MLALSLLLTLAWATPKNDALLVGGGCENQPAADGERTCTSDSVTFNCDAPPSPHAGKYNMFRLEMDNAQAALRGNGWNVTAQYDSNTWQRPAGWPATSSFTRAGFIAALQARVTQLNAGDQFFLGIATHGSENPHEVCLGDGTSIPISEIQPYLEKLRAKGVRVGLMDHSCFSGNTSDAFEGTGVCAMSVTSSSTVGQGGNSIWQLVFGAGRGPGQGIRFYNGVQTMPSGSVDLNGDGQISASEAFGFSRVKALPGMVPPAGMPKISECPRTNLLLAGALQRAAPFFDGVEQALDDAKTQYAVRPTATTAPRPVQVNAYCSLVELERAFVQIYSTAQSAHKIQLMAELTAMGIEDPDEIRNAAGQIQTRMARIRTLAHESETWNRRADEHIRLNQPIPADVLSEINTRSQTIEAEGAEISRLIRIGLHMSCGLERLAAPAGSAGAACREFQLFRANPASTETPAT